MKTGVLRALTHPLGAAEFLAKRWPNRSHVGRMPETAFRRLASIPALESIESICRVYKEPVDVWSDQTRVQVSAEHALSLYERHGMTIYFLRMDRYVPELAAWTRTLERELGLLPGEGLCSAFASKDGSGVPLHFDHDYNFNVQLRGKKHWHLAENRDVVAPTRGYKTFGGGVHEEMRLYFDGTFRHEIPEHAEAFTVTPGSVVYFPRGHWHTTRVDGDSLALDFSLVPECWATIAAAEIRRHLLRNAAWRESALGLGGGPRVRQAARNRLAELFRSLPEALAGIDVEKALAGRVPALAPRSEADTFRVKRGLELSMRRRRRRGETSFELVAKRGRKAVLEVEIEAEFVAFCEWLCLQHGVFSAREAQRAAGALQAADVGPTLLTLREFGVLEAPGARR